MVGINHGVKKNLKNFLTAGPSLNIIRLRVRGWIVPLGILRMRDSVKGSGSTVVVSSVFWVCSKRVLCEFNI